MAPSGECAVAPSAPSDECAVAPSGECAVVLPGECAVAPSAPSDECAVAPSGECAVTPGECDTEINVENISGRLLDVETDKKSERTRSHDITEKCDEIDSHNIAVDVEIKPLIKEEMSAEQPDEQTPLNIGV